MERSIYVYNRVREIDLSLAGHFVRQTSSPSPDIFNFRRAFNCKISGKYETFCRTLSLIYLRRTICPARSNPFAGHFSRFAGHVRRVWQISRTLVCGTRQYIAWTTKLGGVHIYNLGGGRIDLGGWCKINIPP